ncbi:MAG: zinc ribbon domain-containing protein [Candidatus Thiodiazotropha sp.]
MPIYEYRCEACNHELEALQKMSDAPLTECPECKQQSLQKLISAAGFRLKGSGWYETDFKGGKKKNLHDSGKSSSSSESKSSGGCSGGSCACS